MRPADQKNYSLTEATAPETLDWSASEGPYTHRVYHEMADRPVVEHDAMTELELNISSLENLQGRLSFLMREVRYLLKV